MKPLKIKDNTSTRKEAFSDIPLLTKKIADKTLKQLEYEGVFVFPAVMEDAEDMVADQMVLQSVNDCYCSGNVMGYLGCGNQRLVIESRFSTSRHDYFFQYLLDRVLDFPNLVNLETDADQENKLFQFLLFLFPHYLRTAMRKGIYKTYIHNPYNDSHIKGAIDIARHIKRNTPFTGCVAYNQREYSYDNGLMELVRHTIEYIRKKPYGRGILAKVKDEVQMVVDATARYQPYNRGKLIAENKHNIVRHAYYHEYRALQRLCLLILQHQKHQIGSGSRQVYGILFDGAWLWEEYVNTLIQERFYHPMNRSREGAQRLFAGNSGWIYPDFIGRDREHRVIADAKYKPSTNIGNRDYLQLLAYLFRFEAQKGFYLYPEAIQNKDVVLHMNRGCTYERNVQSREDVTVVKHGLKIPQNAEIYQSFVEQMKVSEQEFRQVLFAEYT